MEPSNDASNDAFYSFKKYLNQLDLEEASKLFLESDWDIKRVRDRFNNFVEKHSSDAEVNIPLIFSHATLNIILRVLYPRIAYAIRTFEEDALIVILPSYSKFVERIIKFKNKNQEDDLELCSTILLHSSRALIDNEMAALRSFSFFKKPSFYELNDEEKNLFSEAKNKYFQILDKEKSRYAIRVTFENLLGKTEETKSKIDKIYKLFKENEEKIIFLKNAQFWGMTGFNKIYLDRECFEQPTKTKPQENCIISRIIGLSFHEAMDLTLRILNENFGSMTPRSKNPDDLEGGFLLENYLWGSYDIKYWDEDIAEIIIDEKKWDSVGSFFEIAQMKFLPKRGVTNPKCSGLCVEFHGKGEI